MKSPKINKFVVNPEKRTVAAVTYPDRFDMIKEIYRAKQDVAILVEKVLRLSDETLPQFDCRFDYKFVGVAKCSEEDTFDVEFGKELAKHRALFRYHENVIRKYARARSLLEKADLYLEELIDKHYDAFKKEYEAINDVTED